MLAMWTAVSSNNNNNNAEHDFESIAVDHKEDARININKQVAHILKTFLDDADAGAGADVDVDDAQVDEADVDADVHVAVGVNVDDDGSDGRINDADSLRHEWQSENKQ